MSDALAELLVKVAAKHRKVLIRNPYCEACAVPWPCDVVKLVAEIQSVIPDSCSDAR